MHLVAPGGELVREVSGQPTDAAEIVGWILLAEKAHRQAFAFGPHSRVAAEGGLVRVPNRASRSLQACGPVEGDRYRLIDAPPVVLELLASQLPGVALAPASVAHRLGPANEDVGHARPRTLPARCQGEAEPVLDYAVRVD